MKNRFEAFLIRLMCCFIPNQKKRHIVRGLQLGPYKSINGTNNKIIIDDVPLPRFMRIKGLDINIQGNNNTIHLNTPFTLHNTVINIGNDDTYIEFGKSIYFCNTTIRCCYGHGQNVVIGNNTTIHGITIYCDEEAKVIIGSDCMFSLNITIWASDGHSILDKNTKNTLNNQPECLRIGDHCWIGYNACITKNARLHPNTVVGAHSVVHKDFQESNVVLAGNPAKIVKRDVTWVRPSPYILNNQRTNNA